jgi:hypothetical protein
VAVNRMNREQFFSAMSGHDDAALRKALWNLYWRGTADVRRRIETELAGDIRPAAKSEPIDPQTVHDEVTEFVALARAGAYMGGDRRVSPKERTRWRFTFKQLATAAVEALHAGEPTPAITALTQLIDLIVDARDTYYFRSEDPVSAAGFVVSDAAAALWTATWRRHGFQRFAETAAPQLIRWESTHGWTRYGDGPIAAKETTLAVVLAGMLTVPDAWEGFAEQYRKALGKRRVGSGALAEFDRLIWEKLAEGWSES